MFHGIEFCEIKVLIKIYQIVNSIVEKLNIEEQHLGSVSFLKLKGKKKFTWNKVIFLFEININICSEYKLKQKRKE